MRIQDLEFKVQNYATIFLIILSLVTCHSSLAVAVEKWSGVDETVIEKYAKEQGREAKRPLIDTDRGDLLLFLFFLGGAAGGFAAGYCWRSLVETKAHTAKKEDI